MSGIIGSEIQKNQNYLDAISSTNHDPREKGIAVDEFMPTLTFLSSHTLAQFDHSTHHFHLRKSISPALPEGHFLLDFL